MVIDPQEIPVPAADLPNENFLLHMLGEGDLGSPPDGFRRLTRSGVGASGGGRPSGGARVLLALVTLIRGTRAVH